MKKNKTSSKKVVEKIEEIINPETPDIDPVAPDTPPALPENAEKPKVPEEIPGQLKKREIPIHTLLIIKDGCLEVGELSVLEDKNYFYRVHSRVDGFALIDFDKTDMVPITKDILNRQHTFIEIKYLKFILIISFLVLIGMIVVGFLIPRNIPTFDSAKNEIMTELKKTQQLTAPIQRKVVIPEISPTQTPDTGYNPIFPENTVKNTRKNIPNNAN